MTTLEAVFGVLNIVMGILMWLIKSSYNEIKADIKEHQQEISKIKDIYTKKDELKELKEEIGKRFDKFESKLDEVLAK